MITKLVFDDFESRTTRSFNFAVRPWSWRRFSDWFRMCVLHRGGAWNVVAPPDTMVTFKLTPFKYEHDVQVIPAGKREVGEPR